MIAPVVTRRLVHPLRKIVSGYQRQVAQCEAKLEQSQWRSRDHLMDMQQRRFRELCIEANRYSPFYTRMFREIGIDPARLTLDQVTQLPILERQTIKENFPDITNSSMEKNELIEQSSGGSTGEPVHILRTTMSFMEGQAIKQRSYRWAGWQPGDRHHWFWGAYFDAPSKTFKERLWTRLYNRKFINAYSLSEELFESYYSQARRRIPYLLESYSNILFEFARYIERTEKDCLNIPAIVSSAGKLFDFQRELIQRTVGAHVFDRYGCREMDGIANECEFHNGLHINMERFIVEIDSPDEDGFGDIIVTDFASHGFPLIRYRIQDRGRMSKLLCPCGRGLEILSELQGRSVDTVRTPSGRIITGVLFPQIFIRYPNIIVGQVVQHKIDEIEVLIRVDSKPSDEMLEALRSEIESYTGPEVSVRISIVDQLVTNPTRKHRFVISKI